jgi:hypothetical protein
VEDRSAVHSSDLVENWWIQEVEDRGVPSGLTVVCFFDRMVDIWAVEVEDIEVEQVVVLCLFDRVMDIRAVEVEDTEVSWDVMTLCLFDQV